MAKLGSVPDHRVAARSPRPHPSLHAPLMPGRSACGCQHGRHMNHSHRSAPLARRPRRPKIPGGCPCALQPARRPPSLRHCPSRTPTALKPHRSAASSVIVSTRGQERNGPRRCPARAAGAQRPTEGILSERRAPGGPPTPAAEWDRSRRVIGREDRGRAHYRRSGAAAAAPCRLWLPLRSGASVCPPTSGVPSFPLVPHARAASIAQPSPAHLARQPGQRMRTDPRW